MAIGSLHIEWLSSLALRKEIPAGAAVLDLGTQDLWSDPDVMRQVADRHLVPADRDRTLAAIFDGKIPKPRCQADFYSVFGAGSYHSIDLGDPRADFALDLNLPIPADTGVYDVVTNFGTTEHVFNISRTFANIHRLLRVGGIQLHTLPAYGFIDHGFYNIHPCVYLDMAKANAYEIVDVLYVDNINVRMARPIQAEPFDFGTLPIQLSDMSDTYPLMTKAAMLFQQNLRSAETRTVLKSMLPPRPRLRSIVKSVVLRRTTLSSVLKPRQLSIFLVFDMMFVALRKTSKSPADFVTPIQGVYAPKPAASTASSDSLR